ncbi:MAG TPA: hypothetical protein VGK26_00910 [Thermoanaerobaculia bacterium]
MRRFTVVLAALFLMGAARVTRADCAVSDTTLCLNASRFTASVSWRDSNGRTGDGHAIPITADTGYYWFFSPSNIELVVKVLDAQGVNGKYWVFFGALSNVEYTLTVTDTVTGAQKQYVNPLGQFASVGDTQAFDPNGPAGAVAERVEGTFAPPESLAAVQRMIDATASAKLRDAPAPCTTFRSALRLSSCRFAVDVTWTDSSGRTGRGTPVPLTSDTGYFWFFSPSNVELMVKVLDARGVNGNFWVFYGALTNVQFTLTVTDGLTGAFQVYTNPLSTFASVGDTSAFKAGKSVSPVLDAGRAAFADFDAAGGSLTAAGADGTQFQLVLPPDALPAQATTTIRMTPLSAVQGLPLSKGFLGGVQLEPEGLTLFVPATLTIQSPANLRPEAAAFSYRGLGDEFALELNEVAGKTMTLQILHFSGYGGGNPGPADPYSTTLLDSVSALRQQAMQVEERGREHTDEEGNPIPPELTSEQVREALEQLVTDFYTNVVFPLFPLTETDCNESRIQQLAELVLATQHTAQLLGLSNDGPIQAFELQAINTMVDLLHHCMEVAFKDCVAYKDPYKVWLIAQLGRQLELFGAENDAETLMAPGSFAERCLRFRMDFDSTIMESGPNLTTTLHVGTGENGIKFRLGSQSVKDVSWVGQGPLQYVSASGTISVAPCTRSFQTTGSTLDSETDSRYALILPVQARPAFFDPFNKDYNPVKVIYDPGKPTETETDTCTTSEGTASRVVGTFSLWSLDYLSMHGPLGEFLGNGVGYVTQNWDVGGGASLYGEKIYRNSFSSGSVFLTEETKFTIYHTPDAP